MTNGACDGAGNCNPVCTGGCPNTNPCVMGTVCTFGGCMSSYAGPGSPCPGGTCDGMGTCNPSTGTSSGTGTSSNSSSSTVGTGVNTGTGTDMGTTSDP